MLDIRLTRSRTRAIAIVDLTENGASVALCHIEGGHAQLVSSGSSNLTLETREEKHASTLLPSQLKEAGEKANLSYSGPAPDAVYVVTHAPLATSRTVPAESHYERAIRVQDASITQMAREALSHETLDHSRLMEGSVIRIELNGFPTTQPAGKSATDIRIICLLSECDPEFRNSVEGELHKLFPAATVLWRSSLRASAAFGRITESLGEDFFILDLGASIAEAVSVRAGEIESRTLPIGSASILSKLSGGKPTEETLGALRMLESGTASGQSTETLQKQMALVEPDIVKIFADGIAQMAAARRVSNTLLLIANRDLEPWLTRLLSRIDFSQFTLSTLPFEVKTPQQISGSKSMEGGLVMGLSLVNSELSEEA